MSGAVVSAGGELVTDRLSQLGKRLGLVYAINTFGGILGSFLCGFWLIPGARRWLTAGLRYDPYHVRALETLHDD